MSQEASAVPAVGRRAAEAARSLYGQVGKRTVDIAVSGLLLLLVAPILLLLMAAIRLSDAGPALYRQTRIGRDGVPFVMLKLRTMRGQGPDAVDGDAVHKWEQIRDDAGRRITGIGRILRALSIDELPQLVNVLRGDMSLVGPRPELPAIVASYEPWQHVRHHVRPGLTGPWQISPHRNEAMVLHLEHDLDYVADVRLGRDLGLLVRTVPAVLGLYGGQLGS